MIREAASRSWGARPEPVSPAAGSEPGQACSTIERKDRQNLAGEHGASSAPGAVQEIGADATEDLAVEVGVERSARGGRVARSMTRHDADAEDLVQDTMLRAFRSIDRFDGRHPRAWLVTIMRNAQIDRVRRRLLAAARTGRPDR